VPISAQTMSNVDKTLRIHATNDEARGLGYRIEVETFAERLTPLHRAFAYRLDDQPHGGKFLCASTDVLVALEQGLEILRGVVEHGDPWPDGVASETR
jgi:hypothetical protein